MQHWRAAFAALVILIGSALPAVAAEGAPSDDLPVPPDVSFSVGTRAWWTSRYSEFSFSVPGINPRSELRWRGVDALIPEVNADFAWKRLVLRAAAGWGKSENGVLIDEDFSLDDHNGRFSVTRSSVESEIFYANGDVGTRVFRWGHETSRASHDGHRPPPCCGTAREGGGPSGGVRARQALGGGGQGGGAGPRDPGRHLGPLCLGGASAENGRFRQLSLYAAYALLSGAATVRCEVGREQAEVVTAPAEFVPA
jgi:hypothetical protein